MYMYIFIGFLFFVGQKIWYNQIIKKRHVKESIETVPSYMILSPFLSCIREDYQTDPGLRGQVLLGIEGRMCGGGTCMQRGPVCHHLCRHLEQH